MFCVGRDEDVASEVDSGARALFERDDRKPVQEVIEYLFAFGGRLLRDTVANLCGRGKDTSVVPDLREPA